jgi:hypothetical protein
MAEIEEVDALEFLNRLSGTVAGLRLAFILFVGTSVTNEGIETYINTLTSAERKIVEGLGKEEFQFKAEEFPEGTLHLLQSIRDSLAKMLKESEDD